MLELLLASAPALGDELEIHYLEFVTLEIPVADIEIHYLEFVTLEKV